MSLFENEIRCRLECQGNMLIARLNGQEAGWFTVVRHDNDTYSLHANVDSYNRRKGVSTAAYDWAEANMPGTLVPYDRLSPEAYSFWQNRRPGSVDDFVRDGRNWYSPAGAAKWL